MDTRRGGIGKTAAIGCGAFVALVVVIVVIVFLATGSQVKVLETHLAALRAKDVEGAFKHVNGQFITKTQFQAIYDRNPQVFASADVSFPSRNVTTDAKGKRAEIVASIKGTDGKDYAITYVLQPTGDDWQIVGINCADLVFGSQAFSIRDVAVTGKGVKDGMSAYDAKLVVEGCQARKLGEKKFEYEVVVRVKIADAEGKELLKETEVDHMKDTSDSEGKSVNVPVELKVPGEEGEAKLTVWVDDVVSGKGLSQTLTLKLGGK